MRLLIGVALMIGIGCPPPVGAQPREWEPIRTGLQGSLVAVATHPRHPEWVFAATDHALSASRDDGHTWAQLFHSPGSASITTIAVDDSEVATLLVGTDRGLYGSVEDGRRWARVFRDAEEGANRCTYAAFLPRPSHAALLGTRGGLFLSPDGGKHWKELRVPSAAREVVHFTFDPGDPHELYLATANGVFAGNLATGQWQQLSDMVHAEEPAVEESDSTDETGEDSDSLHHLSAIAADPQQPSTLYLASTRGIQKSTDAGVTWQWLTRTGLASMAISRLVLQRHSPLVLYAAAGREVARYRQAGERWEVLPSGFAASRVNDLTATTTTLWAATDQGLYRYEITPEEFGETEPPSARELLGNFSHEPTIAQVQEVAIRYAEVHPEKIKRWRRQAALQALLPSVNMGMDHDTSFDIHVDEGSYPNFQTIRTKDRDAGFDVSINWDLGELIWNDDQTSIDVRSKLTTQLRDDIVDEVTRTYFERRRIQIALLTKPPTDQQTSLEKELGIQELTALIDGLTGGYFSRQTFAIQDTGEITASHDNL